jgi:hypothetical protein
MVGRAEIRVVNRIRVTLQLKRPPIIGPETDNCSHKGPAHNATFEPACR